MDLKSRRISRENILLFLTALLFLTGAASGQESENNENTQLKVIQLSPDAGPMDVFVDGEQIGNNLGFGDLAGVELEPGTYRVRAVSDEAEVSTTVDLQQNRSYTLTINNRVVNPGTTLLSQTTTAPENQARVRFAHFSPDLLVVDADIQNGNAVSVSDLSYLETSTYATISPGEYTVDVEEPRIGGIEFDRQVSLEAGSTYTLFISGLKSGGANGENLRVIPVTGTIEQQVDENGNGDDDEDEDETEDGIVFEEDLRLVCRLESNN